MVLSSLLKATTRASGWCDEYGTAPSGRRSSDQLCSWVKIKMAMVGVASDSLHTDSQPRVVGLGLRVGGCLGLFHIHQMNWVNSRSGFELRWQNHKHCHYYYYYYYQLKHTGNTVVFNVFQCLQYDCDYLQLCAMYSCRQFDNLSRLRLRIDEHFGEICAARELGSPILYFYIF